MDTGTCCNFVKKNLVKRENVEVGRKNFITANGSILETTGTTDIYVNVGDHEVKIRANVTKNLAYNAIIGRETLTKYFKLSPKKKHVNIIKHTDRTASFDHLLEEFRDIFANSNLELGEVKGFVHNIHMNEPTPVVSRAYRVPLHLQTEVRNLLDEQLRAGVIRPSRSPWRSPVVFTKKKNGSYRFCIDLRRVNDLTTKDKYPLPLIDECLDNLNGAKLFSSIDLQSGYWQIPLAEEDKEKTAFTLGPGFGLYEYNKMPFGLVNAPATFQRMMDNLLGELPFLLIYLDDIIIHSTSHEEHLNHLKKVFIIYVRIT